jgi:phage-related protein
MANAAEVVVRAKPEGIDETKEEVEDLSDSLEETTEGMESQAGRLAGFSKQFAGAMSAATTGLALAATSLLGKVPVIGELFDGVGAIMEALALTMDSVLRPVLGPLGDFFLQLSTAILEADPAVKKFIGSVLTLASGAGLLKLAEFLPMVGDSFAKFNGKILGTIKNAGGLKGALRALIAPLTGLSLPVLLLIAVIAALALAWATNFGNIRGVAKDTFEKIKQVIRDFVLRVEPTVRSLLNKINDMFGTNLNSAEDVANAVFKAIGFLIVGTVDFILTTIEALLMFIDGDFEGGLEAFGKFFERTFNELPGPVKDVVQDIIDEVTRLVNSVTEKIDTITSGIDSVAGMIGIETNFGPQQDGGGGGGGGAGTTAGGSDFIGSGRESSPPIYMDSTRVDQQQGRARKSNANVRGL